MYSLDDQLDRTQGQERGVGVFRPGVNVKFMTLKQQAGLQFRLLPAFDPTTMQIKDGLYVPMDLKSWVPFRDPQSHQLQTFARPMKVATFIGHGKGQDGRRRDLLSPITFDGGNPDEQPHCPLTTLFRAAENDPEWMYLTEDKMGADNRFPTERRVLSFPSWQMVANVVDVNAPQPKVELGVFTTSAYNALLSKRGETLGLVWQTANITDPEVLSKNPLCRWACGDLTSPLVGPVLSLTKATGPFGKYGIQMAKNSANQVLTVPISEQLLEQRYNLYQLESIVVRHSDEEIIHELVKLLNGVSPSGQHEWLFLRKVFGHIVGKDVIPDPPAQGYVQGYSAPAAPPAAQPGPGLPAATPAMPAATPAMPAATPAMPAAVAPPAAQGAPLLQQAGSLPPAAPVMATSPSPEMPAAAPAPAVGVSQEQRLIDTAAANPAPVATPPAANPAPAAAPPAGQNAPLPGDQPPQYDQGNFLQRLRDSNSPPNQQ